MWDLQEQRVPVAVLQQSLLRLVVVRLNMLAIALAAKKFILEMDKRPRIVQNCAVIGVTKKNKK
jgi:hypothetical protein